MAKKKPAVKKPEKSVPINLTFSQRVVQASPTTFILVERMLKFAVVQIPGKIVVVPLVDGQKGAGTVCFLYPAGTTPKDAMKQTIDALWNKAMSGILPEKGGRP